MKKTIFNAALVTALTATTGMAQAGLVDSLLKPAQTANPIMLVPGIFAFDTIASVDYWYQIPSALENKGASVYVAKINAFDSSAMRGEALIAQLEEIKAASKGKIKKFNLMGHSQGGMTSRYVMNVRPDLVASVTTMHTPHSGSPLADLVSGAAPEGTVIGDGFEMFANAVGDLVNLMSNNKRDKSDVYAMLSEFDAAGAAKFNSTYPAGMPSTPCGNGADKVTINGNNVRLYSWGGTGLLTTGVDISDALFALTSVAFKEKNDGVTGQCASHFGQVLRDDYNMNHIDLNNHVLGLVSLFETNPKTLFVNHAIRLKKEGL